MPKRNPKKSKTKQNLIQPKSSLPSQNPQENQIIFEQKSVLFGPLPPAEELAKFEKVAPGLCNLIVQWADEEKLHRRAQETRGQTWDIVERLVGQIFGMLAIAGTLYTCIKVAEAGHPLTAGIVGVGGIGSVAIAFIQGRNKDK
jgi:uncharacterized membrane protein